ncbi:MAG: tetratricopeptide repeat protein [Bacteroidales bacterium]|nr:tetratricopeptide repeat protein [Bacteroidales bacterium]
MRTILNIAILLSLSTTVFAQNPLRNFREGNRQFQDGNYNAAEILYRRGLEADSNDIRGRYNLANALYKQGEYEKSAELYNQLLNDKRLNKKQKTNVFHNLGNTSVRTENYQDAVNAYKEAMKLNPHDDTRYNLAYALQRMQQQQQEQQEQDQKNDQNQQQKNQQDQQSQQNQNQQQQQQQQQNQDRNQGERPDQMKKSDAERMLNAMDRQERNTLDKKKKIKVEQRGRAEKDW